MTYQTPAQRHMGIVAGLGCVICRRDTGERVPCQVHHIAEGSGQRSDYMTAGLVRSLVCMCRFHVKERKND